MRAVARSTQQLKGPRGSGYCPSPSQFQPADMRELCEHSGGAALFEGCCMRGAAACGSATLASPPCASHQRGVRAVGVNGVLVQVAPVFKPTPQPPPVARRIEQDRLQPVARGDQCLRIAADVALLVCQRSCTDPYDTRVSKSRSRRHAGRGT